MVSAFRSRFFRGCVALFFLGAAILDGWYSVLVWLVAFDGHGSPTGSSLLFGLGFLLVALSILAFISGLKRLKMARISSTNSSS